MAKVIVMPKLGYAQDEGAISQWFKKVGDKTEVGEAFFEAQTDKSLVNVDATFAGTLLKVMVEPMDTVPVFTPIAVVGEPDEDADAALAEFTGSSAPAEEKAPAEAAAAPAADAPAEEKSGEKLKLTPRARKYIKENNIDMASVADIKGTGFQGGITERDIKASPLARRVAEKLNVDLSTVAGTGVGGKIMKEDVEKQAAASAAAAKGSEEKRIMKCVPYNGVRKIIGDRLSQSKFTAPHLYFTDAVDTTELTAMRKKINESGDTKIAVSDLLTMAASRALQKFPGINVALEDDQVVTYESTNIGVAVAGNNGLVVPVIKNVQDKTLRAISAESRDLIERAKDGKLSPAEYSGGTFTISNLGMFGIGNFTAIINPPESAILSISSVRKSAVVLTDEDGNDTIAIRPMMNIQLSVDHRVIDGLLASQFLEYYKYLLENPLQILM